MPKEIHGQLTVEGKRFAVVVSRFNEFITSKLLGGAVDALVRHGCEENNITCVHVPGAFELPFMAKKLAESGAYDAVICVGCVIRGQTPHFEYVSGQAARGMSLKLVWPMITAGYARRRRRSNIRPPMPISARLAGSGIVT